MIKTFILVFFLLVGCAINKPPIWVKSFGKETFYKNIIDGVGFANFNKKNKESLLHAREIAYNYAIKNLSLKLKTHIKGVVEYNLRDKIMYTDKNYKQHTDEQINSLVNILFDVVLGRKYFEEYIDNKNSLYWVYVWTTKDEIDKIVLKELEKQELENISILKSSIDQFSEVESYIKNGNLTAAIKILNTILSRIKEIKGIVMLDNVDNISLKTKVENRFNKLITSTFMNSLSPTTFEVFDKKNLYLELRLKMYIKYNGKNIPVSNFPLVSRFVKGAGTMDRTKFTDNNGEVIFRIYEASEKENIIEILPDLEALEISNNINIFSNLKVVFYVIAKSLKETSRFYINIKQNENFKTEFLKNEFLSLLSKEGFSVVEDYKDAEYIIFLDFNLESLTDKFLSANFSEDVYGYSGSICVKILKKIDNSVVLSRTFEGLKGFGKTKKEAELNLLKKLAEMSSNYFLDNLR